MGNDVDDLGRLSDDIARAAARFRRAGSRLGTSTGEDGSGTVTVRLDPDGTVRAVGLTSDWVNYLEPEELGPALIEAYTDAVAQQLQSLAEGLDESSVDEPPPALLPSETLTGRLMDAATSAPPASLDALADLLEDFDDKLAHLLAAADAAADNVYRGRGRAHRIEVTVDAGGTPTACTADVSWLRRTHATNIARELTEALQTATAAARAGKAAWLDGNAVSELQRLANDPDALARRLGMA